MSPRFTPTKEWIDERRTGTRQMYLLRALVLLTGAAFVAVSVLVLRAQDMGSVWAILFATLVGLGVVVAALRPEASLGAGLVLGAGALWWWFAGWQTPWWQAGIAGLAAVAFHQASAWAAAAPLHAVPSPATVRRLGLRGVALLGASTVAVLVAGGASLLPVGGQLWWQALAVLALIGVVALAVTTRDRP